MEHAALSEFARSLRGPLEDFKPRAFYIEALRLLIVETKACTVMSEFVSDQCEVHWESSRPRYAPWKKCVGFCVLCPPMLGLGGEVPVTVVLDRIVQEDPGALGKRPARLYRCAKNLTVYLAHGRR